MKDKEYQTIVLAALLHDIGKFMQRAEIPLSEESKNMEGIICPVDKGRYSHRHVLWTNEFFEEFVNYLPNRIDKSEVANLASYHHRPETPLQWIITEADRLSSGMDRLSKDEEDEVTGKDVFKRIRLRPILEEVMLEDNKKREVGNYRYEINPLSIEKTSLFPKQKNKLSPVEGEPLVSFYKNLWEKFINEFNKLPLQTAQSFIISLVYLLEKYTWCIPSSTKDLPDISLFDHLKTTCAIAANLYNFHSKNNVLSEQSIKDRDIEKYLLVCGDLTGIQKFIYKISSKGAAKGLKGRSFYLQLRVETIANHILRKTNYPLTNLLYSGGGGFYLLLDSTCEEVLIDIQKEVNKDLLERFNGEIYLALGWCFLKGNDFTASSGGKFYQKWKEVVEEANQRKRQKFSELSYEEIFSLFGEGGTKETCDICKNEDKLKPLFREEVEEIKVCPNCFYTEKIGEELSKAKFILETYGEKYGPDVKSFPFEFADTRYYFLKDEIDLTALISKEAVLYTINKTDMFLDFKKSSKSLAFGYKFIAGNFAPLNDKGNICTFDELAKKSSGGLKRLGILRMDVDNLGLIFSKGLGEKASISRVTELSRKLAIFFSGYLNKIAEKEKYKDKVYIIYSGGDDLFIVGAWDKIPDIARDISRDFREFVCLNPDFTLSAGISLIPGKYPIYKGAELAGNAEENAKGYKRDSGNGIQREKDALSFLETIVGWDEFGVAYAVKEVLVKCIKDGKLDKVSGERKYLCKGIINRLRWIYLVYLENKKRVLERRKELSLDEIKEKIQYNQWLWKMVYSLNRYAKQNELFKDEIEKLMWAILGKEFNGIMSNREIIDFINLPTRWAEFLLREEV